MNKLLAVALIAAFSSTSWAQKVSNQAFEILDKNRDGFLSKEEAAGKKELAKRFTKFDANKDGKLDDNERATMKAEHEARRAEMLQRFDTDKDGKLSDSEREAMRNEMHGQRPRR